MIFVTGDTHGLHDFAKMKSKQLLDLNLTKEDYVIIAGDCGIVFFEKNIAETLKVYDALPYTTLF